MVKLTQDLSDDFEIIVPAPHLTCLWMRDHQIAVYTFAENATNETVDVWLDHVVSHLQNSTTPAYFVHDFSKRGIPDYYSRKILELSQIYRDYRGRSTFVLSKGSSPQLRVDLLRQFSTVCLPNWVVNAVYTRFNAVEGLIEAEIKRRGVAEA